MTFSLGTTTIGVSAMLDVRDLNRCSIGKAFDYVLAMNYVHRALSNLSRGNAGKTDKARARDAISGRKAHQSKSKETPKAIKAKSGSHTRLVDENDVLDIVQDAFLIFWKGNGADRTTRRACRFALLHYLQAGRGRADDDKGTILHDYARHLEYMYHDKRIGGTFDDNIYDTIALWLSTGASQSDVSRELGLSRQRVSDAVASMRKRLSSHIDEYPDTIPHMPMTGIPARPVGHTRVNIYASSLSLPVAPIVGKLPYLTTQARRERDLQRKVACGRRRPRPVITPEMALWQANGTGI